MGSSETASPVGGRVLGEFESKAVLTTAGLPVNPTYLARTVEDAHAFSDRVGFPVVMKISSPAIVHKSDVGGVVLNLNNGKEVEHAYNEMMGRMELSAVDPSEIEGVTIQKMAPAGVEVVVGMTTDAQFGQVMMFGLGGVMVEVMKDVAFRLVPLSRDDAADMVREIRGFQVLEGYRGGPAVHLGSLETLLMDTSRFVADHPYVAELDLNPVLAYRDGCLIVDARIVSR